MQSVKDVEQKRVTPNLQSSVDRGARSKQLCQTFRVIDLFINVYIHDT